MKSAKDWGWREFVTLHTLFDADSGYLLNDDCVFAAEVLMLRESSEAKQVPNSFAFHNGRSSTCILSVHPFHEQYFALTVCWQHMRYKLSVP